MQERGVLCALEGNEGSGKTTLFWKLYEAFKERGVPIVGVREPGGTDTGDLIRDVLLNDRISIASEAELLLFLASRVHVLKEVVVPALRAKNFVLMDRYDLSSKVYQLGARQLPEDPWLQIIKAISGSVQPDLWILLTVEPEVGLQRVGSRGTGTDRLESERIEFHRRVYDGYQHYSRAYSNVVKLDTTSLNKEEVFTRVYDELIKRYPYLAGRVTV